MVQINVTVNAKELPNVLELLEKHNLLTKTKTIVSQDQPAKADPTPVVPQAAPVTPAPVSPVPSVTSQMPLVSPVPVTPAPVTPVVPQAAPVNTVPVTTPAEITLDQLSVAGAALLDAGRQTELIALLSQYGVQALTQLPKEQYGAFATALRGLGARI